jgi:uncharacterized protein (TIGR03086 family)
VSGRIDLAPAARQMVILLDRITDDQLTGPTPCERTTVADLVDHVGGLSLAFTEAARQELGQAAAQGPSADGARLGDDWRTRIPAQVTALAEAWADPAAWEGMTRAGGMDLPAVAAGRIALDELVLHGWDLARAIDAPFECDPAALEACWEFVSMMATPEHAAGREGLFGPVVEVSEDRPVLDRVVGLAGRDPDWSA